MHRQFSLQPFSRHYSHSTNPFLDFLEIEASSNGTASPPDICVTHNKRRHLLDVLTAYKRVQTAGTLHTLTFVTVNDYLWLLRAVSHELSVLRRKSMYYLAAAVSDFFLPRQRMVSYMSFISAQVSPTTMIYFIFSFLSLNTKFNQAKGVCSLRWIRCQRS